MKYYCVKQHDITDCAAACLATICKQNGYKVCISRIREVAGTDMQGTNIYGIITAAEQLGFQAKGVKGNKESLFSGLPLPCIAHMIVDGNTLHYVVIHKITDKKVLIADPNVGIVKLRIEEFLGEIHDEGKKPEYCWSGILVLLAKGDTFADPELKTKSLFGTFLNLIWSQKTLFIHIFTASLVYTALGILGAFYFKTLIDSVLPNGLEGTLTALSIGVILLNIFKVILNSFRTHLLLYLCQKIDIRLLLGYYDHVLELPTKFFDMRRVGEIISRFNDASKIRDVLSGATLTIMIDTFMAIVGAVMLYVQSRNLFAITVPIILLYAVVIISFHKSYEKLNRKQMEDNEQLTSWMIESLNGIQTVKSYNAERKIKDITDSKFAHFLHSIFQLSLSNNIQSSLKILIESVGGVIILWMGSRNVISGNMTIGSLITFCSLLDYFLEPIMNLINLQPQIQTAVVATDRLGEILGLEIEKKKTERHKMTPSNLAGDIEIKNLSFRYGTREYVLKNIDLKIENGQKVAFVGESGSGKTTLSKLLLHFYSPEKGAILINGNNIEDIQLECLREKIAYISQETFLFSGTILENLTLGLSEVVIEDVIKASKTSQTFEFINELPLRYETKLEENGSNLSGGQRQRLAITRALLKKPDILILDEATSNLDSITEKALEKTFEVFSENITTIFIAHRLSTIKKCDKIFVMEKGKIVESGTHEELTLKDGKYMQMVRQQSLSN